LNCGSTIVPEPLRLERMKTGMQRVMIVLLAIMPACVNTEYRVERIDGNQSVQLPLKFDSMFGMRDGEFVTATPVFADGNDTVRMTLHVRLGPPITFVSGDYQASVGERASEGSVVCDSLSFLGGQNALPSVGGIFVLRDSNGRPLYRVKMPATPIARRNSVYYVPARPAHSDGLLQPIVRRLSLRLLSC
jgi:hypothetical protein